MLSSRQDTTDRGHAAARAREGQDTEQRPIQGNSTARAGWWAGICSCSGAFAPIFFCRTPFADTGKPEDLSMRFFRHGGIYQSDVGSWLRPSPSGNRRLPPTIPTQAREHAGRTMLSLIVLMSSGRLFLDRVGRHQSPSPLHRRDQINMQSRVRASKEDILTLPGRGHFYFALTNGERSHVIGANLG